MRLGPPLLGCSITIGLTAVAVPAQAAGSVPTAPRSATATAGNLQITVGWAVPTSAGASAITGYQVACASSDGGAALSGTAAATATALIITTPMCTPHRRTARCSTTAP